MAFSRFYSLSSFLEGNSEGWETICVGLSCANWLCGRFGRGCVRASRGVAVGFESRGAWLFSGTDVFNEVGSISGVRNARLSRTTVSSQNSFARLAAAWARAITLLKVVLESCDGICEKVFVWSRSSMRGSASGDCSCDVWAEAHFVSGADWTLTCIFRFGAILFFGVAFLLVQWGACATKERMGNSYCQISKI